MSPEETPGTRDRLLSAAEEVLAERGYDGTTIARVTARAGVPASSLYWFFRDKEDLIAAVVARGAETRRGLGALPSPTNAGSDLPGEVGEGLTALVTRLGGEVPAPVRIGLMFSLERRSEPTAARRRFLTERDAERAAMTRRYADALGPALTGADPGLAERLSQLTQVAVDGLHLSVQAGNEVDAGLFGRLLAATLAQALAEAAGRTP